LIEISAHEVSYQKHWKRFNKRVKRGVNLMRLFGVPIAASEWLLPLDWENPVLDYRPVNGEVKQAADQGVGQRAAEIDGAEEQRRQWKHQQVDITLGDPVAIEHVQELIANPEVGVQAALEWLDYKVFDDTPQLSAEALDRAEITDLMSMRLNRQPVNLNAAPLGDLFGEQLHWKTTSIEKMEDGTLRVWKYSDRQWVPLNGVLTGQQVRLGRWAKQRDAELNGVEAPKVTRETLNEYTEQRNNDRKVEAIHLALAKAVELIQLGVVPSPSDRGKGRPSWLHVALTALGECEVSECAGWIGKCSVDGAAMTAAREAARNLITA